MVSNFYAYFKLERNSLELTLKKKKTRKKFIEYLKPIFNIILQFVSTVFQNLKPNFCSWAIGNFVKKINSHNLSLKHIEVESAIFQNGLTKPLLFFADI